MTLIKKISVFAALSSLALISQAQQQAQVLDYKDVFELEYAASPQAHPQQEAIVYERRSMDIMHDRTHSKLWQYDLQSNAHLPLLSDAHNYRMPRYSADGEKLAYISDKDGSQQIYIRWLNSGHTVKASNLEYTPSNITWSPDGKHIAFTMFEATKDTQFFTQMPNKPKGAEWAGQAKIIDTTYYRSDGAGFNKSGFTHIFIVSSEGGSVRKLTSGDYNHAGKLSWSKDSQRIYFAADRHPNWELRPLESDIFSVDLVSSEIQQITNLSGPESNPQVSPDGKHISFMWVNDRKLSYQVNQLMLQALDKSSDARSLTAKLDRSIQDVQWAANGKSLYLSYLDNAQTRLAQVSLNGKLSTLPIQLGSQALGRPYTSGDFTITASEQVIFTQNNPQRPADLALLDNSKKVRTITSLNEDALAHLSLAQTSILPVKSSVDRRQIDAWIALPANMEEQQKVPLILEIHGGPHAAYADTFSMEVQLMAAKGYAVVWSNPRGSSSYGEDFGNLIHHNYPSQDYDDLMDVVDAAIATGKIDRDNLFITGGSGGGVLTAWSIGKTDRFAAAVVAKPVINWLSFALTADAYPFFSQYWMEDMPWNIADKLWARSPLSLVGNVKTPTMLLTGEVDYRTPMSETEQYYQALRLQSIESAMVRIPGASHGIASRPSHLIQKVGNIVAWFDKYNSQKNKAKKDK